MTKLTICTAVIVSLAFTANLSAAPTIFLDAESLATGIYRPGSALSFGTIYGNVDFVGEIKATIDDPELAAKEGLPVGPPAPDGKSFDIVGSQDWSGPPAGDQTAELFFSFDVISVEFLYGGNFGSIYVEARDAGGAKIVSFTQDNTGMGQPVGPETLSGTGIRSLFWEDKTANQDYATLDNIVVTVIPSPSAFVLAGIGVSLVSWLRKRRIV